MSVHKNLMKIFLTVLLLAGTVSCSKYPGMDQENSTQLVSFSYYDSGVDYTSYKTFYIADSMGLISDGQKTLKVKNARSELIRNQVAECLRLSGFTQEEKETEADLDLSLLEVERTNYTISADIYYPYYWDIYGFWGYGYYYPPYFPQYYVSSIYSTQTFSIQMGDRNTIKTGENGKQSMSVIWIGIIKGLSGQNRTNEEIQTAIRECFTQTPCLPFSSK